MFTASVTALMGEKLLQMYPNYCADVFAFDGDSLSFFFGLPKFAMRYAIARRDRIAVTLTTWAAEMTCLSGGAPIDPEGLGDPYFGSCLNRVRQSNYKESKLNARSGAAFDLGMTFGLSSNAIPAGGWMLMNALRPDADPRLLDRVLAGIRAGATAAEYLDVTLRLYLDVLVTRNLSEDLTLPIDDAQQRLILFKKGDFLFAPALIGHSDPVVWASDEAPPSVFHADRFIVRDPTTGHETFGMGRTVGKFFPSGGGAPGDISPIRRLSAR